MDDILETVIEFAKVYSTKKVKITSESNIYSDLGFTSLDRIGIIIDLEDRYNFCVVNESDEKVKTIEDLVNMVKKLKPT